MMKNFYSAAEYADIVFIYGYCDGNAHLASREYKRRYPNRHQPSHKVFGAIFQRLRDTGTTLTINSRKVHVGRNIAHKDDIVIDAILNNPTLGAGQIALQLNLPQNFIWQILNRKEIQLYLLEHAQELLPEDYDKRVEFCQWLLSQVTDDPDFITKVLWSDEATFTRDGVHTVHNSHLLSLQNSRADVQSRFQQRFNITVWAGIFNNQLLEIEIFDGDLNAERYKYFLKNKLHKKLEDTPLHIRQQMWYQHDGAPPHHEKQVVKWLNRNYCNRWIGRKGPVPWPPRSPDLNPLVFNLWGHLGKIVYSVQINSREQLRQRIIDASNEIREMKLNNVLHPAYDSLIRRCDACIEVQGQTFEHLL